MKDNFGLLLVDKPKGRTSFSLVASLRRLSGIEKIGHAGTLDPFATGVMVLLIGKPYTQMSDRFLNLDKEYLATVRLGVTTDTFDCDGQETHTSEQIPTLLEITQALSRFQGKISQIPPMFSAKKIGGKKLYELARKGVEIERPPVEVTLITTLIAYEYPHLQLKVTCSKGTYMRSLAYDLGKLLGCGAHLSDLVRLRSGPFLLENCIRGTLLDDRQFPFQQFIKKNF